MRIGLFDSGFGGLTIYHAIRQRLPAYDYVYLGDNARTPYGHRSFETVYRFTAEAVRYLFAQDCALIVIACNTASAKALRTVQQRLLPALNPDRRVLGIISPSVEALAGLPAGHAVALWATPGTVQSESYALELGKLRPDLRLVQIACPLLVPPRASSPPTRARASIGWPSCSWGNRSPRSASISANSRRLGRRSSERLPMSRGEPGARGAQTWTRSIMLLGGGLARCRGGPPPGNQCRPPVGHERKRPETGRVPVPGRTRG